VVCCHLSHLSQFEVSHFIIFKLYLQGTIYEKNWIINEQNCNFTLLEFAKLEDQSLSQTKISLHLFSNLPILRTRLSKKQKVQCLSSRICLITGPESTSESNCIVSLLEFSNFEDQSVNEQKCNDSLLGFAKLEDQRISQTRTPLHLFWNLSILRTRASMNRHKMSLFSDMPY
jgi:hypothetical protein